MTTRVGNRTRAAAADPAAAGLMGINVRRLYAAVFALAAGLAAVAGLLTAVAFSVSPDSGTSYLLVAIAVVVLGGVGNIFGTFVGALFLAVVQSVAAVRFGGGSLSWSIIALLLTIVGGIGTIVGPVMGTVIVYYVLTRLLAGDDAASVVIEGLLLVVVVRFAPQGVWPTFLSTIRRISPGARTRS